MDYLTFKKKIVNLPFIVSRDLIRLTKDRQALRNQLNRWQKKGLISKLKRGMYILNVEERKILPSRYAIAAQLYAPSYVSLETALSFYGLIPEKVADITSITTRKTMRFRNSFGSFIYQHLKPEAFRGFKAEKDENGISFFIAEPEKAVVDFIYLNMPKIPDEAKDFFKESLRFQNTEALKKNKLIAWQKLFRNPKLTRLTQAFCAFTAEEKK